MTIFSTNSKCLFGRKLTVQKQDVLQNIQRGVNSKKSTCGFVEGDQVVF